MEVHHHSNIPTSREKKWTHYLWEFLMLVLAIFCGFLAENKREHFVENHRAKELARSFYHELQSDSANLSSVFAYRQKKENAVKYIYDYINDSSLAHLSNDFCPKILIGLIRYLPTVFEPRDAILDQLKNSGMLRYFKDPDIQAVTAELTFSITHIRLRNEREMNYFTQYVTPFILKYSDQQWLNKITEDGRLTLETVAAEYERGGKGVPCFFNNPSSLDKNEAINMLSYYRRILSSTRQSQYSQYDSLNRRMLYLLRKNFKLK